MKSLRLILNLFLSLIMIYPYAQNPDKSSKAVKPKKFNTTIKLINSKMHYKGNLVGYTDTTIVLETKEVTGDQNYFLTLDFKYSDIQSIDIKHKISGMGVAVGAITCGVVGAVAGDVSSAGSSVASSLSGTRSAGTDQGNSGIFLGAFFGAAIGAAIGGGIESGAQKKYVFPIDGSLEKFSYHLEDIKLFVIER